MKGNFYPNRFTRITSLCGSRQLCRRSTSIRPANGSYRDKQFLRYRPRGLYWRNMAHRKSRIFSVLTALLATTFSAAAHHGSNVSYHTDQTMTIAGTVTEWEFVNPRPQIYFDVKTETGEIVHWAALVVQEVW
jgi:hypothetical protein